MLRSLKNWRLFKKDKLKSRYEVVVIGAGVHGLSTAYHLAKRGINNVAVFDKSYLGGGSSGRNTQIIRANTRLPESTKFYKEALEGYEKLSKEVNLNLLINQCGHLTLAHSEFELDVLRLRAQSNRKLGVDSRVIGKDEIKELVPYIDLSENKRFPIVGALWHPRGGNIRHDAVVWGYASVANKLGVEIYTHSEVKDIKKEGNEVRSIIVNGEEVKCNYVINATAGWCSTVAKMVDIKLPITTIPLQACVSEPLKPFMNVVLVSVRLAAYFYQTERGEFVMGAEIDPYPSYSYRSTLPTLENIATAIIELVPCLSQVKVIRQWAGICDLTPDFSPIMGEVPEVKGFLLNVGWGTYGFKTAPASGKALAELIATGKTPELIKPFSITRFYENRLMDEKASAQTAH
ncbi:MAG: FAD-dependent oxidoreductase [Nitrososphaerales archaeon]